jgi:DNA-directed RNA polymerase specialized sigma24 family protein
VARLLALPEGTVKSRLFLARRHLKERLQWIR